MGEPVRSSELTEEKSLIQIWKVTRQFKKSAFNSVVVLGAFVGTFAFLMLIDASARHLIKIDSWLVESGFVFATTMLGFLIAGFAIFLTFNQTDFLLRLARIRESKTRISYLKFVTFHMIDTFIYYFLFGIFCFVLMVLLKNQRGISELGREIVSDKVSVKIIAWIVTSFIVGFYVYVFAALKSFIYNVYISVMIAVRLRLQKFESKSRRRGL